MERYCPYSVFTIPVVKKGLSGRDEVGVEVKMLNCIEGKCMLYSVENKTCVFWNIFLLLGELNERIDDFLVAASELGADEPNGTESGSENKNREI